ncbi:unnamed protein product, partial [Ixodes persulcatus]
QPPFQATFRAPHPFPAPTPVDIPTYAPQQPKQRIFTVHDLPTRRDLGEAFVHVQNANRSSQLLARRDIIELQLLEPYLEVWDSFPPLSPQSKLRVFDRVRLLYHVATSGWNATLDGYADPSASYLLGPPTRRVDQPAQATSPTRARRNPGRQSRKDNPKKNPLKEDNPDQNRTISLPRKPTSLIPTRSQHSGSWSISRTNSPPSHLKRTSLETDNRTTKRTRRTPRKTIPADKPPDLPVHPIPPFGSPPDHQKSTGQK